YMLIKRVNTEIQKGNIESAKELYEELMTEYNQITDDLEEKQKIYNEVLKLHSDINLALLE
ncbi:hypothetical protein KY325_02790, partial [Candidatus Woesearchaeota archaeon]|nr:hypothetical protein [Candidatus Woesearchaeota archaeon]